MDKIAPFLAVLVAGFLVAVEGATNGWLTKASQSLYTAMLVCFGAGFVLLLAAWPFLGGRVELRGASGLPWYGWVGGVYVLGSVALAAWATPKLGAGPALIAALLSQAVLGLVLDHFGVLGLERSPLSWLKVAGILVMVGGAVLVALGEKSA